MSDALNEALNGGRAQLIDFVGQIVTVLDDFEEREGQNGSYLAFSIEDASGEKHRVTSGGEAGRQVIALNAKGLLPAQLQVTSFSAFGKAHPKFARP